MGIRRKQLMGIFLSAALAAGSILVPVSAKEKTDVTDLLKVKNRTEYNKGRRAAGKNQAEIHVKKYRSIGEMPGEEGYKYSSSWQGKTVKIYADQSGLLVIGGESEDMADACGTLYDASGKEVKEYQKEGLLMKVVSAGTVYSLKLPEKFRSFTVEADLMEDHQKVLRKNDSYVQTATGGYFYHEFTLKKRSMAMLPILPFTDQKLSYNIQRKTKAGWKMLSKTKTADDDYEKALSRSVYGLAKGNYRAAVKGKTGTPYLIGYVPETVVKKYKTKKSKAKKITLESFQTDLYTDTERASRWYRISRKTAKKKRYIEISTSMNSGKLKFTIYKKGRKKPLKIYKLSGQKERKYRLKHGAGTYYIKVSKIGKNTNGVYSIEYL